MVVVFWRGWRVVAAVDAARRNKVVGRCRCMLVAESVEVGLIKW